MMIAYNENPIMPRTPIKQNKINISITSLYLKSSVSMMIFSDKWYPINHL